MRIEQLIKCFFTTSETEGEVGPVKTSLSPQQSITDRSKAVVLLWFSVACFFCVRDSVTFHLMFVHIISSKLKHIYFNW